MYDGSYGNYMLEERNYCGWVKKAEQHFCVIKMVYNSPN